MIMIADVIQVNPQSLLVRDTATGMEVQVNFSNTARFAPGDRIRITYNGIMTQSIPPQISASAISRLCAAPCQPSQTQMRATVQQVRANSLLVRNEQSNAQTVVNTASSRHFCVGQRILVTYDSLILSNPPQVNATDISALC